MPHCNILFFLQGINLMSIDGLDYQPYKQYHNRE